MAGEEIGLEDMLLLRERRADLQHSLLQRPGCACVVCLTLNIAGPVKRTPLTDLFFDEGRRKIAAVLTGLSLDWREERLEAAAGLTACYCCGGDPVTVKRSMILLEEESRAARLWDIDVLYGLGQKVSRAELGVPERRCFLCGNPAVGCARSRRHTVEEMWAYTTEVLWPWYVERQAESIGMMAQRALLHEVAVTPKPGLVDRNNNGAHRDMDFFSFLDSACVLRPYFARCARWGLEHAEVLPEEGLPSLQILGMQAEEEMYRITSGANTHKGAIFSLGILSAAAGILAAQGETEKDAWHLGNLAGRIAGGQAGQKGARASAANGYTREISMLKKFRQCRLDTGSWNRGLVELLLQIMGEVEDTNLLRRGGEEGLAYVRQAAGNLLRNGPCSLAEVEALDQHLIQRNLSPGGSADLLAILCFLYFWEKSGGTEA